MQRWHRERHIARRNWRDRARLLDSDLDQSPDDGLGVRFPHLPLEYETHTLTVA